MIELMLQAERALSMGLVDSAEHLYWQAVESDGRNVIAIVGLAKVALARGDDRTALQFARKALELDPEDGAARRLVERLEDLARLRTPDRRIRRERQHGVFRHRHMGAYVRN